MDQSSKQALLKYKEQEKELGRSALNSLYPNEFELYLIALELVNSKGETEEYLVFPITPDQIRKTENNRTNVKKSSTGTTVLFSKSFTPNDVSISGNFGRSFRLLSQGIGMGISDFRMIQRQDNSTFKTAEFDPYVKSGFGATKLLQKICSRSTKLDQWSKPYRLYFYNMALSESYLVVVPSSGLVISQSLETNMIWTYNLSMIIIANLQDLKSRIGGKSSSPNLMKSSTIQNGVNSLTGEIGNFA